MGLTPSNLSFIWKVNFNSEGVIFPAILGAKEPEKNEKNMSSAPQWTTCMPNLIQKFKNGVPIPYREFQKSTADR